LTRPTTLLVATTNPGKTREIVALLGDLPIRLLSLADLNPIAEAVEDGRTFADNARIKALYYAAQAGLPTVAEDSGLAIDALGGRPGVESARYPGRSYADKFANLYAELAGSQRPWTARFVCSLTFVDPSADPRVRYATEATVEGEIAREPRGVHGFGYDPIFFFPPYGTTLGDVPDLQKLEVAHRGKAFRAFRSWLLTP
jgi:XTP/dITP diphosphohydrolase